MQLHECAIVMGSLSICCVGAVEAFLGAQLLELLEGGFLLCSQMANVTFQPRLWIGSFWRRRPYGTTTLLPSESVHNVMLSAYPCH